MIDDYKIADRELVLIDRTHRKKYRYPKESIQHMDFTSKKKLSFFGVILEFLAPELFQTATSKSNYRLCIKTANGREHIFRYDSSNEQLVMALNKFRLQLDNR